MEFFEKISLWRIFTSLIIFVNHKYCGYMVEMLFFLFWPYKIFSYYDLETKLGTRILLAGGFLFLLFYQRKISRSCQLFLHHEQWYCNDDSMKVIDDNIIILHFPFSICIFFPSKRCWIECCRDFQIEQLQMAAVGYFTCGNSNISTFYMMFRMFEVFFSRISAVLVFLRFWQTKATFFANPIIL